MTWRGSFTLCNVDSLTVKRR